MFKGNLVQMPLDEVFRLLMGSNQTGILHLHERGQSEGGPVAQIGFQVGQLVEALAGEHSSLDAVNACAHLIDCDFVFEEGATLPGSSLVSYDTGAIVEEFSKQLKEYTEFQAARPSLDAIPVYQKGRGSGELEASADDLALLLLCDGKHRVMEICVEAGRSAKEVQDVLGKLKQAGVIAFASGISSPSTDAEGSGSGGQETPSTPRPEPSKEKPVQYWRGRPIR